MVDMPARLVYLERTQALVDQTVPATNVAAARASNLAYVIYTSGSTG